MKCRLNKPEVRQTEKVDTTPHRDFDGSVMTKIVDYYRRFVQDPDFQVSQLPPVYDFGEEKVKKNDPTERDDILDLDEPEFGEMDLEYFGAQRNKPNDESNDDTAVSSGTKDDK